MRLFTFFHVSNFRVITKPKVGGDKWNAAIQERFISPRIQNPKPEVDPPFLPPTVTSAKWRKTETTENFQLQTSITLQVLTGSCSNYADSERFTPVTFARFFWHPKSWKSWYFTLNFFLWAELSTRDVRTEKIKLVTSQPTWGRFVLSPNYFRLRDTEGQSRSICNFSTPSAPPSGPISKPRQVRRPYLEAYYQPTKFEKNLTRGSPISPNEPPASLVEKKMGRRWTITEFLMELLS